MSINIIHNITTPEKGTYQPMKVQEKKGLTPERQTATKRFVNVTGNNLGSI